MMARPSKSLHSALRSLHVRSTRGGSVRRAKLVQFAALAVLLVVLALGLSRGHAPSQLYASTFGWPSARAAASASHADEASLRAFATFRPSFVFVFSTGRSGTQHLSRLLQSDVSPRAYVTHEEEHETERTRVVVDRVYRRLGASSEGAFNASALHYVREKKLPFYTALAAAHNATRLVYTGHVPLAFGLGPALLSSAPVGAVRVLRMRRARFATALSLMALGPAVEDPWGPAPSMKRRWFPTPSDSFTRLEVSEVAWARLNRFQRWLWYVDDIECRWQGLKNGFSGRFKWMEVSLEALSVMDGGRGWQDVARFMGLRVNVAQAEMRHNSIQHKGREKESFSEPQLREWDMQYRHLVGDCRLGDGTKYHW